MRSPLVVNNQLCTVVIKEQPAETHLAMLNVDTIWHVCLLEQARKNSTGSRRESNDAASVKSGTSHRSSRSSRSTRPLVSGRSKRDIETGDNLLSNAAGLPGAPVKEEQTDINRKWRHSLVTCGSGCSGCMYSLFCPMCAIATARTRFDGSHWCSNCFFLTSCMARNIIREGYDIDGHCCYDICWPCICLPCVANQLLAETLERGSVIDRWSKNPHRCNMLRHVSGHMLCSGTVQYASYMLNEVQHRGRINVVATGVQMQTMQR
eukprot:18006-Heterococcus_DN1.PRE.2